MKHTTHNLTNEQKEALFNKHKDLISLVHMLGDMALRKQIKTLYCMLHPDKDITTVEFDIAELIVTGFLLQVQIQKPSKTQMLYLSKYPRSHLEALILGHPQKRILPKMKSPYIRATLFILKRQNPLSSPIFFFKAF